VGNKKDSQIIINSNLSSADIFSQIKKSTKLPAGLTVKNIFSVDASKIALEVFGKNMVNTAMLGALSQIPGLLKIEGSIKAVKEKFSDKGLDIVNKNIMAIKKSNIN
jgi:pyruvate ferredoxin oxidoreductase gamma subunit